MNEADTCRTYILPKLKSAGWEDEYISEQRVLTPGRIVPVGDRHTRKEGLRPDYTLFIRQNIPIAVMEAKAEYAHPAKGLAQAMQYAALMDVKFAYSSNGKEIVEHDFLTGLERTLEAFPSPDELWGRLISVCGTKRRDRCRGNCLIPILARSGGKSTAVLSTSGDQQDHKRCARRAKTDFTHDGDRDGENLCGVSDCMAVMEEQTCSIRPSFRGRRWRRARRRGDEPWYRGTTEGRGLRRSSRIRRRDSPRRRASG